MCSSYLGLQEGHRETVLIGGNTNRIHSEATRTRPSRRVSRVGVTPCGDVSRHSVWTTELRHDDDDSCGMLDFTRSIHWERSGQGPRSERRRVSARLDCGETGLWTSSTKVIVLGLRSCWSPTQHMILTFLGFPEMFALSVSCGVELHAPTIVHRGLRI